MTAYSSKEERREAQRLVLMSHSTPEHRMVVAIELFAELDEAHAECEAWKAKTRESVRNFLTEHPDLRIRQISDENGVLEAKLDLANTKLLRAIEALKWYASPENNGKRAWRDASSDAVHDAPVWRAIDDDEGDVAREILEAIGDVPRLGEAISENNSLSAVSATSQETCSCGHPAHEGRRCRVWYDDDKVIGNCSRCSCDRSKPNEEK